MNDLLKMLILAIALTIPTYLAVADNWDHCENEYYFGDGNTFYAFHCILYPPTVRDSMNSTEGVLVTEILGKTLIEIDMDEIVLEPQEMIDYLDGLYFKFKSNQQGVTTFPGYQIPTCMVDYATGQPRSVYLYAGQILVVDDGKC